MNSKAKKDNALDFDGIKETNNGISDVFINSTLNVTASSIGIQNQSLKAAIDNYALALNQSAIAASTGKPVNTPSAQYKGFAAEEYFKQTLKINALAKGVPDWKLGVYTKGTMPDGTVLSGIDMETDISIWLRKSPFCKPTNKISNNYQSKIHNNSSLYLKDLNNPQYSGVKFVGGAGQGVNDKIGVQIGNKYIKSDSITSEDAYLLAEQMKAQNVKEYTNSQEKMQELHGIGLRNAVISGAAAGAIFATIDEIINIIKNRNNLSKIDFLQGIQHILVGSVDGAIRGGAIVESVELVEKMLGKKIEMTSLGAVPSMALANVAVSFAEDAYKCFVIQDIDTDDLLCNTINNTFSSFSSFGGAYWGGQIGSSVTESVAIGAAIGSPIGPMGIIIGSVLGGALIGLCANAIIGVANKDAISRVNECIISINSSFECNGVEKLYYFADSMSELSEFRLSFKSILPCYNLISDLKEYNLRKKAIKEVRQKLNEGINEIDENKRNALKKIEEQHQARMKDLQNNFEIQKQRMFDDYKASFNNYIQSSYAEYLTLFAIMDGKIDRLMYDLDNNIKNQNTVLAYLRDRNEVNKRLNATLKELMKDGATDRVIKPLVDRMIGIMNQDEFIADKQYISWYEAKYLVDGGII